MKIGETLQHQLEGLVADCGLELLAIEQTGQGPRMVVRLVVDGPNGVTLDQCTDVSRQVSALLDVESPVEHAYNLEVSSPGLDRKLYRPADYERFEGQTVKIRMKPSYRDQRVVLGRLLGLEGETVKVSAEDGHTLELPLSEVFEARLEVDWKRLFGEGKSRR